MVKTILNVKMRRSYSGFTLFAIKSIYFMENNIIYGKSPDSTLGLFDLYLLSALTKQKMVKTYDKSNFSHDFIENPKKDFRYSLECMKRPWADLQVTLNSNEIQRLHTGSYSSLEFLDIFPRIMSTISQNESSWSAMITSDYLTNKWF